MTAPSANNNVGAFIGAIKLANTEERQNQMFSYIQRSCEEFTNNENLRGINQAISELGPYYPVPIFALITAKFQLHNKMNIDELRASINKLSNITQAVNRAAISQQSFATFYFSALKALTDACLSKKVPLLGLKPLIESITWFTDGHPEHLTPAHGWFLCLCLKARHFYLCDPFINVNVEAILTQGLEIRRTNKPSYYVACGSEPILLFFYYAALIRVAQGCYKEGLLLIEQLVCCRGIGNSAIALAGFKVAVIVGLILDQDQLFLPGCRILKFLISQSRVYMGLAYIVSTSKMSDNVIASVKEFVDKNRKIFNQDGNLGLTDVLIGKLQEKRIMSMPKTFLTIDRPRAMPRALIKENDSFDCVVRKLINNGQLNCVIDGANDTYRFCNVPIGELNTSTTDGSDDIDNQLSKLAELTTTVRNIHDRLRTLPQSATQSKGSKKRANVMF